MVGAYDRAKKEQTAREKRAAEKKARERKLPAPLGRGRPEAAFPVEPVTHRDLKPDNIVPPKTKSDR